MELGFDVPKVTMAEAVDGMRRPFHQAFGRTWVGQRLGAASWAAFHAALVHGVGIETAMSYAQVAAEERNQRTALVARWTSSRISRAVRCAAQKAADAA